ncbi:MAG: hypothetical protein J6U54_17545 [Clostridiales bacterium]|nr:hypothetical protein [Clostridiales bacterium]
MSSHYDDRIVRMGFNNAKFESGARQTMSTLDKLNEKLKLKGASEGTANIQKEADSVDFSSMERAIKKLEDRFSTMGIVGMNVINKITDGIVGSVKQLEAATIGQIKTGGWNRAMNIANAKFQIEGLGFAWEEVEKAVSYGVKDTAYGLDAAASAASQLAASGVDFQKVIENVNGQGLTAMHKSLRAISGVAAMTNSSYEDISRIFTTVAGNGRLMGDQLLQLSTRGMNAAAKLAEILGTTETDIRDMVHEGMIDFETFAFAMDDAFGQHAKEANKTFTGALSNMKAALSRVGEIFSDPIVNKTNTLFISLTARIDEFKNKLKKIEVPKAFEEIKKEYGDIVDNAAAYNEILKVTGDKTITLGEHFAQMWESGIEAFSLMVESVDLSWLDGLIEKVDNVTVKITGFFNLLKELYGETAEETAEDMADASKSMTVSAEEAAAARDIIIKGLYGTGQHRRNALTELFGGGEEGAQHAKNVQTYINAVVAAGWSFEKSAIQVEEANDKLIDSEKEAEKEEKKAKLKEILDNISSSISNLFKVAKNLAKAAGKIIKPIVSAFGEVFKINFESITEGTASFTEALVALSEKLIISDDTAEAIKNTFIGIWGVIKEGLGILEAGAEAAYDYITSFKDTETFANIKQKISDFFDFLKNADFSQGFGAFWESLMAFLRGDDVVDPKEVEETEEKFSLISDIIEKFKGLPTKISNFVQGIVDVIAGVGVVDISKIAMYIIGIYSLSYLFLAIRKLGDILNGIGMLPQRIGLFLTGAGLMFRRLGIASELMAYSVAIKATAAAIAIIGGVIIALGSMETEKMYDGLAAVIVVFAILMALTKSFGTYGRVVRAFRVTLAPIATISALLISFGLLLGAITYAIGSITAAAIAIDKFVQNAPIAAFGILFAEIVFIGIIVAAIYVAAAKLASTAAKMVPILLSFAVVMFAVGNAILTIATAMGMLSLIPEDKIRPVIGLFATILGGMAVMLLMVGSIKTGSILGAALMFASMGIVMLELAAVVTVMSAVSDKRFVEMVDAIGAIIVSMIGLALVVMLASGTFTKTQNSAGRMLVGFIGIVMVILAVTHALTEIGKINNIDKVTSLVVTLLAEIIVMIALVGVAVASLMLIGTYISGGDPGKALVFINEILTSLALVFVAIAASLLIFALSLEKIAGIGEGLGVAVLALVGFVVVLIALAAAAAWIPGFGPALDVAGKAMLSFGLAAALIGASVFLVCAGIKLLSPALAGLSFGLESLFRVLEAHPKTALIVGGAILVLVIAIALLASKLAPLAKSIVDTIGKVVGAIGNTLGKGATKFRDFVTGMTTKGKAVLITMIATLCAALGQASPQVMQTVGTMIVNLLKYLGEIAGDIIKGLIELIISLLNGLADAIGQNSARIAAACWNVVLALFDVMIQILAQLVAMLIGIFSKDLADKFMESMNQGSVYIRQFAEDMRDAAEQADAAKKGYAEALDSMAAKTESTKNKVSNSFTSWGDAIFSEAQKQTSTLDSLKEQYNGLPGYAYDAILRSQNPNLGYEKSGKKAGSNWAEGFLNGEQAISMPSADEYMAQNGMSMADFGDEADISGEWYGNTQSGAMIMPDEYYEASDTNMQSSTQAIEDSEDDTRRAIQDHYVKPSKEEIGKARPEWYKGANQCVEGAAQAIAENQWKYRSAITAMARLGIEDFERENKISSPSKVYRQLGEYIILGLASGITQNTNDIVKAAIEMSDAAFDAFETTSGTASYDSGKNITDDFVIGIQNGNSVSDAVTGLTEDADKAMTVNDRKYYQSGRHIVERFSDGISDNTNMVSRSANGIFDTLRSSIRDMSGVFTGESLIDTDDLKTEFYHNGEHVVSGFTDGVSRKAGTSDYIRNTLSDVVNSSFGGVQNTCFKNGKLVVSELVDGISGNADSVTVVSSILSDQIGISFNGMSNVYFRKGEDIVSGLADGVSKNTDLITDAGNRMADAATDSFGSRLSSFYQNGANIVNDFAVGIAQNTDSAIGAANNLSDAVVNAFGTPINYVSKISAGELQYDASVRPVFDDRGLYRGASAIDSMLNEQTISVTGLSGKLAADIGTLDRNNADIVDELRALREDMSYMEEAMSQMQVVMDTGALVGSMAGPMDKAMGRRAIYRGRGN